MGDILHIGTVDKFTVSFWRFLQRELDDSGHRFLSRRQFADAGVDIPADLAPRSKVAWLFLLPLRMYRADKVVIHGLFDAIVLLFLLAQPWLLRKVYWVMWGGDVYFLDNRVPGLRTRLHEKLRELVIPRIGYLLTYIDEDVQYLRERYGASGTVHSCLMYPSNTFVSPAEREQRGSADPMRILAGNSALRSNRHDELLEILRPFREQPLEIYCPLSYGPADVVARVSRQGTDLFGPKFVTITEFLPPAEFDALLQTVDSALFAHSRQQAMGTTISLLGYGARLFMRKGTPHCNFLESLGLTVFDFRDFDLAPLSEDDRRENRQIVRRYFSLENLKQQWSAVFND